MKGQHRIRSARFTLEVSSVAAHGLSKNLGNNLVIQSRMSRTSTFWVTCTEYRLVPYSPACDLRTLGLTYITPQISLHSVPFTDISLFRDGSNPGKPFCTALLSFAPAYLGYDRYVHNHICVFTCNDPVLYKSR